MTNAKEAVFKPAEVQTRKGRALIVRAYKPADLETLIEMYSRFEPKRVAQGLPPPDVPRIARWLDQLQQKSYSLLAFESSKVVAHTVLCPISQDEVEFTIFVLQDYREEGLGTMLSKMTLDWASDMRLSKVLLTTELSNYRAVGLFRKLGFDIKSCYGDECEMKLDLFPGSEAQAA